MKKVLSLLTLVTIFSATICAQEEYRLLKTFHILSAGGWDYLAAGPGNGRLYVSHGTQVNILDLVTGDSVGIIENTTGVHGIAFDPSQDKGFTSNGRLNNVTVFNLRTNAVITQVGTGQNPDAIMYEPFSKKIITCNGRGNNLSIIDPVNNRLVDSIALGGKPETAVSDAKGNLYVNIEDKNEIVKVDMVAYRVTAHWSLSPAEEPTGLSFDPVHNTLFAACGNKLLAVVDAATGKIIQTLPIGENCDGDAFDPQSGNIFTSNGEGTISVYHQSAGTTYNLVQTLLSKKGARTIALDPQTHLLYLPTAEFEKADPKQPQARPRMIPGTFQVLVIGRE